MGTRGPLPKAARQRVRDQRRRDDRAVVLAGTGRKPPPLPRGTKRPAIVVRWWKALWASPLAAEFKAVDEPALFRLACLWASAVDGTASASLLAEARQLEDRFGLNPQARRRLDWRSAPKSETDGQLPQVPSVRRLRAIDPAEKEAV